MSLKLTTRELDIMKLLWNAENSMTSSEIATESEISINTIQATISKLLKKNLIEVGEIVYSGTVLTRSYLPVITKEEFIVESFYGGHLTVNDFIRYFIKKDKLNDEAIKELEMAVKNYRNNK